MSKARRLLLVAILLMAVAVGYELGRVVQGGRWDWSFILSSSVATLLVYLGTRAGLARTDSKEPV